MWRRTYLEQWRKVDELRVTNIETFVMDGRSLYFLAELIESSNPGKGRER